MRWPSTARRLWGCRSGAGAVEYILLLAVVAMQVVVAFYVLTPYLREGVVNLLDRILDMKP